MFTLGVQRVNPLNDEGCSVRQGEGEGKCIYQVTQGVASLKTKIKT